MVYGQLTDEKLENWFTYHKPEPGEPEKYQKIREAALAFAKVVRDEAPPSADTTVAIRHIRDAVMNANAAIACKGQ